MKKGIIEGGYMTQNGIRAWLENYSYFGVMRNCTLAMHFNEEDARRESDNEPYPETCTVHVEKNNFSAPQDSDDVALIDFCFPLNGTYAMEQLLDGTVAMDIFASAMPNTPILQCVFPDPLGDECDIYKAFMCGIGKIDADADDLQELTIAAVDTLLILATGDAYGSPPDVAAWLYYVLGGRCLTIFLSNATVQELRDVHILITAKVMDGSLCLLSREDGEFASYLVAFCASRVAEKLTEKTGDKHVPYQVTTAVLEEA